MQRNNMEPNRLKEIISEEVERVLEQESARITLAEGGFDPYVIMNKSGIITNRATKLQAIGFARKKTGVYAIPDKPKVLKTAQKLIKTMSGAKLKDAMFDLRFEGLTEAKKIKIGQQFNADGITWKVIKVGATQSRAEAITKSAKKKQGTYDNKTISKFVEGKLTEVRVKKGDIIKMQDGEYGVVNKLKGKVAYIKLNSNPGSFHPIEADRITYKGKHKGKDLYSENVITEKLARGLKPLLVLGSKITKKVGEDVLVKLSDKFDRIDDEYAGDIASHLDMAIELMQDGYPGDATKKLKQFNKACKDVLKGKSIKSAFAEGKLSVVNEAEMEFGVEYRDSKGNPKKKGSPIIMRYKNKAAADKFAKKGNQIDKVGGKYTVVRVPMEEDTGKSSPYGSGYKKEKDLNEAEYITNKFKKGQKIKTNVGTWIITQTNYKPGKKFKSPFVFRGPTMKKLPVNLPSTNSKAVGYKVKDDGKYPITGFLYQHKDITILATIGVDESISEAMDMNDPILIAVRARKTMLDKAKSAPKVKKISMNQYYKLMDKEIDLINQMKGAAKEYEQLDSEMNQEAGQKGADWSDADANRYGGGLNKIQTKIEKLAKQKLAVKKSIMNYRMS